MIDKNKIMDERNDYNSIPMQHTQTAVEWLYKWFNDNHEATIKEGLIAFEQAKQMEKQQMLESSISGSKGDSLEQYYNQTYNKT